MSKIKYLFVVLPSLILSVLGQREVKVMQSLSKHIGNVVLECKAEMGFGKDIVDEFLVFWNTTHMLSKKEQGCVVSCIMRKLELLEPGGVLKKDNANAFAKSNGADAVLTEKLSDLYNLCSRAAQNKNLNDGCDYSLELAKCFRYGIFAMRWAPTYNVDYRDERDDQLSAEVP